MSAHLIAEIIVSTGLGGFVGWVTNAIAINMLFKKYGKWGGVVEAHYEEFISNMAQLVEDHLVNGETLGTEFNSPQFKAVLQKWIEDILLKELPQNSGGLRFKEIPGIEHSVDRIIDLVKSIEPELIQGMYKSLGSKKVQSLLSEEHYNYIIDKNIGSIFADAGKYEYKIQNALASFLQNKTVNTLISESAVHQVSKNIGDIIQGIDFSRFDSTVDRALYELIDTPEVDRILSCLKQRLGEMRFAEFVNNPKNLSRELLRQLHEFANSAEGRRLLHEVIADFLTAARTIDLLVADVVNPAVREGIVRFCNEKMPGIINRIVDFVRQSKTEIEMIVNDTVDNQLDTTLGGKIGKIFNDIFSENLAGSQSVNVVGKIIDALNKQGDKAGDELSRQIITMMETKTIGEILGQVQDSGIFKVQSIADLINLNLKEIPDKDIDWIDHLLKRRIGDSTGAIDISVLFDTLKQEYLYNDKFKHDIRKGVTEMARRSVSDFFDVHELKIALSPEKIKNSLRSFWNTLSGMNVSDLTGTEAPQQLRIKKETFKNLWRNNSERELNQLYHAIQNDAVYTKVAEGLIEIVNQNLDTLLAGNVSTLVNSELGKLKPPEVNAMVQDFMGREMKSINILGAVLGAVIGAGSAWAASLATLPVHFIWWMLAVYGGVFAFVGIITNWLAIKMLFRPYIPVFPGAKIPPFVGVVAARKPAFAKSLSNFVKNRMLRDDVLKNYFLANKAAVKDKSFQLVADSDYALIDTLFADKTRLDTITNFILLSVQSYLTGHREEAANAIGGFIKQQAADGRLYDILPVLRDSILKKLRESDLTPVIHTMIKKEIEGKKLAADFSGIQLKKLFEKIVQDLTRHITLDNVKKLISRQNDAFMEYVSTHTLEDLAGSAVLEDITGKITDHVGPLLHKGIGPIIKQLEKQEFNPGITLRDLFHGAIPKLLEHNITYIIDIVCGEIAKTRGELISAIKDNMPFYTIPWKSHVDPIVDTLLDEELPQFLHRKREQLTDIINTLLENKLSNLGFNDSSLEIETIERRVTAILDSPHVQRGVAGFVTIIIKQFAQIPLNTLLRMININSINDVVHITEPLISSAVSQVKDNLSTDAVIEVVVRLVKNILPDILSTIKVEDVLKDIELEKELRSLITLLINDTQVMQDVSDMIDELLYTVEKDPAFYDDIILRKDMAGFIAGLEKDYGWDTFRLAAVSAFKAFLSKLNGSITTETKNAICNEYLITAVIDSCVYNFTDIIRTIDVQTVVEREVNNMHPKGIETLFYQFAGTYFAKITLYGWIGVFGGFLSYIVSSMLAKFIK
ncbi:hypothetical protein AGMMS49942_21980 [Spirochaetia bacterium]|nr:hypothetical protein AGMMS49942_21980 [Spirochaetia bacterium]